MKRLVTFLGMMILAFSFSVGIVSAHVTVQPEETTQGSYEVFTVRVPSENDEIPTTQVKVEFSSDVHISRFEPKPGWKYELEKDESDKIISVTWVAENEGLLPTEFGVFNMQGRVADDATEIVWRAYQTYEDGSVVEWVGAEDSQLPASVTIVNPKSSDNAGGHHGAAKTDESTEEVAHQTNEEVKEPTNFSNVSLYISIVAFILGLLALSISLKRRA